MCVGFTLWRHSWALPGLSLGWVLVRGPSPDCHSELWAGTQPSLVPTLSLSLHMDTHQT